MPNTTTIATVTVIAAAAIGVAYFTQPQWFSTGAAPAAATAPATKTSDVPTGSETRTAAVQPPTQRPPADAAKSPAEAATPASWIGLPVISADGATIGQVSESRPHADGRSFVLVVKAADGKSYDVSSAISTMQGRAVQVAASKAEIGTMVR